jgi:hypothetical protein
MYATLQSRPQDHDARLEHVVRGKDPEDATYWLLTRRGQDRSILGIAPLNCGSLAGNDAWGTHSPIHIEIQYSYSVITHAILRSERYWRRRVSAQEPRTVGLLLCMS